MTAVEGTRYAAAMAWVEQLVADSPKLQQTKFEFYTLSGQLWVQVQGGHWEAHAWQVAVGGLIRPSYVDGQGVLRQMILGQRVHVEIIDDPRLQTRNPEGGESDGALLGLVTPEPLAGGKGPPDSPIGETGRIHPGVVFIAATVGLFLWGWTHSSRTPNGATLTAVAIIGATVLIRATFGARYRRRERKDAAYTKDVESRLQSDTTGDHIWDA